MTIARKVVGRVVSGRRLALAMALAVVGLLALTALARAAGPAWKVAAASGPTYLPPQQSEVQQLTLEAEGGNYTLSTTTEAIGTMRTIPGGQVEVVKNSAQVKIVSGEYQVGQKIEGEGLRENTLIASCSTDCKTPGSELTLTKTGKSTVTAQITIGTKELEVANVFGRFAAGGELTGQNLLAGTTIIAVTPTTLTLSEYPRSPLPFKDVQTETTLPMPPGDGAAAVQSELESLPVLGTGAVAVGGGPGGDAGRPLTISFEGGFRDEDVPQLVADAGALTGDKHFAIVSTRVPGGPGTGELAVYNVNVGGASANGPHTPITVTVALPAGILVAETPQANGWTCTSTASEAVCKSEAVIPAAKPMVPFSVPVEVGPLAPEAGEAIVTASGGDAPEVNTVRAPISVSTGDAPFGLAAFWGGAFDADGRISTQAGGHPFSNMTFFMVNTDRSASGEVVPAGDLKDVGVALPPGFVGDPLISKRCPQGLLAGGPAGSACEQQEAEIGTLSANTHALGSGEFLPVALVNDVPVRGSAAEFSAKFGSPIISLLGSVRSKEDFGVSVSAPHVPTTLVKSFATLTAFSGFPEATSGKAFFRNPTDCSEQARKAPTEQFAVSSWQGDKSAPLSEEFEPVTGCDKLHFDPEFTFQPTSTEGSSGVGATAHLHIDQSGLTDPEKLGTPDLKQSVVTLPEGFTVNPAQASGLEACSEAQVGYVEGGELPNPTRFNEDPVTCPDASKLGTAEVVTPLLEEPLEGTIYLARQDENPFHSLIALYLVIESPRFGITLKLPGKADLDARTGRITATFDYVPQQPVEGLTLHFRGGGPRSEFATPEVCGEYSTTGVWTPWSAPESGPPAHTSDGFKVSSGCASSSATRPFRPSFEAGSVSPIAGAFSPLVIKINRNDGEQELKDVTFTLPPGMSAKLAGVPYCSEAGISAASSRSGREEQSRPSCPEASQIGTVNVGAGVGSEPFYTSGKVYLAGPYKGAPLSAVVITPAVAGPFDLGNVVVRAPLNVNLETAQITAQSDPIPTILDGIPLKVRSITVKIDRTGFSLNPTNCEAMSATASLGSSDGALAAPSNRFQVGGCENLGFKPKLKIQLKGATKRAGHPALKAVLTMPPQGNANIASAQVGLPHSLFLDQGNLNKVCKQADLRAGTCPKSSIYGHAKAWSPLLDKPLEGPVYLGVGYGYKLPALVADLDGQIRILLHSRVDTTKQKGLRNTFEVVPDAPVSRFVLQMKGGRKYSLLENSENLCAKAQKANARFIAQNGRVSQVHPKITVKCKKKSAQHKHHGNKN